jgi:hypothetical protein
MVAELVECWQFAVSLLPPLFVSAVPFLSVFAVLLFVSSVPLLSVLAVPHGEVWPALCAALFVVFSHPAVSDVTAPLDALIQHDVYEAPATVPYVPQVTPQIQNLIAGQLNQDVSEHLSLALKYEVHFDYA